MSTTPLRGWTVPDPNGNDDIGDWPGLTYQLGVDIENSSFITNDSKPAADTPDTYPIGMTVMGLTGTYASSAGWPGKGGLIMTVKESGSAGRTSQLYLGHGANEVLYRNGRTSTGWNSWVNLGGVNGSAATASGSYTFHSANAPTSTTIAFPAGRFSAAPTVTTSTHNRNVVAAVSGVSATGFTLLLGSNGGGDIVNDDYPVDWIAMQNY